MTEERLKLMLATADLSDETARLILADALEGAGFPSAGKALRENLWFNEGYTDVRDFHLTAIPDLDGSDCGWDSLVLAAITHKEFATALGLADDLDCLDEKPDYRDHPAWKAACREYNRGGHQAAEEFIRKDSSIN